MILKATCCCESTGITLDGEPVISAVCHCNNCQKRTGSAFGISIYFKNTQVTSRYGNTDVYKISNEVEQERHFCKTCGTTLYWQTSSFPGHIGVAGGCFDIGKIPDPEYTLSNENKCSWLKLPTHMKNKL